MPSPLMKKRSVSVLTAFALSASALGFSPQFLTPPAHSATPGDLATLVSSFQNHTGCATNWDPACSATAFTHDKNNPNLYELTLNVPKGEWEFKVAMNGNWAESYGKEGFTNNNIPLILAKNQDVTFTFNLETKNIGIRLDNLDKDYDATQDESLIQKPATHPGANQQFYFVLTDRFANADPSNDRAGLTPDDRLIHGYDPTDKAFYHGGDIAGLISKLDYIQGLGTTAIWLTPSFKNMPVLADSNGKNASSGYHGYWITDFTTIDPHLGTNDDLKELITQAHAKGMKVYFDIVANHTADLIKYRDADGKTYIDTSTKPYTDAQGHDFNIHDVAGKANFPELDANTSFPYIPYYPDGNKILQPEWLNDVTLYHNRGDSTWDGESVTLGDFLGLDDLMTENPKVINGMAEIYKSWVDFGLDGFRIDTVKHVDMEFWRQWSQHIADHAKNTNKPEFFTFGEVYNFHANDLAPFIRNTAMNGVLDFMFQNEAVKFARGESTQVLHNLFQADDVYTTPNSNAGLMPTFLGNHDMGRIGYLVNIPGSGVQRSELAHSLMYLTRGQPVVYYGDEQGFVGNAPGTDKEARQSLFASQVEQYQNEHLLDNTPMGSRDHFDTNSRLYTHIARLAQLRRQHKALHNGAQIERWASHGAGIYAFSRVDRDEKIEYLVGLNNSDQPQTQTLKALTSNAQFDALYGSEDAIRSDSDATVTVTVPAFGAVVYKANKILDSGHVSGEISLRGHKLSGRQAITTTTGGNQWSETSFSYRILGEDEWTPLGVDTAQNATVFHDVTSLPTGTIVEYRTITSDAAGNHHASSGWGVVNVDLVGEDPIDPLVKNLVTVPGTFNNELGCPSTAGNDNGDWAPDCESIALTKDPHSDWWTGKFNIPAGEHHYKVALNGSWKENWGKGSKGNPSFEPVADGENATFTSTGGIITFFYNEKTHYFFNTAEHDPITLPGDFNNALGCTGANGGNWNPACLATLMQKTGPETYTYTTDKIPAGNVHVKAAHTLSWQTSYGPAHNREANYQFNISPDKRVTFTYRYVQQPSLVSELQIVENELSTTEMDGAKAHWLDAQTFAIAPQMFGDKSAAQAVVKLHYADNGRISLKGGKATVDQAGVTVHSVTLERVGSSPTPEQLQVRGHLSGFPTFRLPEETSKQAKDILRGALAVSVEFDGGEPSLSGVQIPGVVDALYAQAARSGDRGVVWTDAGTPQAYPHVNLWAPTARKVHLELFDTEPRSTAQAQAAPSSTLELVQNTDSGMWTIVGEPSWKNKAYRFVVDVYVPSEGTVVSNVVTDPYSLGLAVGSTHSVFLDMKDPDLAPAQWSAMSIPSVPRAVDQMIYELHVRDFSISDSSVPEDMRGTYMAFTQSESAGMRHLRSLGQAGVNSLHLLPTYDIASIPEPRSAQTNPQITGAAPDSTSQQAQVEAIAATDGFNWGYDPYHYFAPEGSYAVDPSAAGRVKEYRQMVAAVAGVGMRVVADQVFNHTYASGQNDKSVLDKVVPGYFHRLNWRGELEQSTCCDNVGTESQMAEQLMVDSVLTWARDYKVSGFRFDLMGHHSAQNMLAIQKALDAFSAEDPTFAGTKIHLYGEGWNFGEVANNARFRQASQGQLGGTQIGTFNDRIRDGIHGEGKLGQGWGTGQGMEVRSFNPDGGDKAQLGRLTDLVRLGLAGNLKDFRFRTFDGSVKSGSELSPGAYGEHPADSVNYVDAHDNATLFDTTLLRMNDGVTMQDRVRMNTVQLAAVALGQSPAFWHAGTDLLRSKSLDINSYNSGDHFNRIDWTGQSHNFGMGMPPLKENAKDGVDARQRYLLTQNYTASPAQIALARDMARELVQMRHELPLITLGSADLIRERVSFPAAGPGNPDGLIIMHIDDRFDTDLDPQRDGLVLVFNSSPWQHSRQIPGFEGRRLELTDIQRNGVDEVVKNGALWDQNSGTVTIPARSVAVFDALPVVLNTVHEPVYESAVVKQGDSLTVSAPVSEGMPLPTDVTFSLADAPDWVEIQSDGSLIVSPSVDTPQMDYHIRVTVRYADGSEDLVDVLVTVSAKPISEITQPADMLMSVPRGVPQPSSGSPVTTDAGTPLPQGARFAFVDPDGVAAWLHVDPDSGVVTATPDAHVELGNVSAEIRVTYSDGSEDLFTLNVSIVENQARLFPVAYESLVESTAGGHITVRQQNSLPAGTTAVMDTSKSLIPQSWTVNVVPRSVEGDRIPAGAGRSVFFIRTENLQVDKVGDIRVSVASDAAVGDQADVHVTFTFEDGSTSTASTTVVVNATEDSESDANTGSEGSDTGNSGSEENGAGNTTPAPEPDNTNANDAGNSEKESADDKGKDSHSTVPGAHVSDKTQNNTTETDTANNGRTHKDPFAPHTSNILGDHIIKQGHKENKHTPGNPGGIKPHLPSPPYTTAAPTQAENTSPIGADTSLRNPEKSKHTKLYGERKQLAATGSSLPLSALGIVFLASITALSIRRRQQH